MTNATKYRNLETTRFKKLKDFFKKGINALKRWGTKVKLGVTKAATMVTNAATTVTRGLIKAATTVKVGLTKAVTFTKAFIQNPKKVCKEVFNAVKKWVARLDLKKILNTLIQELPLLSALTILLCILGPVHPIIGAIAIGVRILYNGLLLLKHGNFNKHVLPNLLQGKFGLEGLASGLEAAAGAAAKDTFDWSAVVVVMSLSLWFGFVIAESAYFELLACALTIAFAVCFKSVSTILCMIFVLNSATPFFWILSVNCTQEGLVWVDLTTLLVATLSSLIGSSFMARIFASSAPIGVLVATQYLIQGCLALVLALLSQISSLTSLRYFMLAVSVREIHSLLQSPEILIHLGGHGNGQPPAAEDSQGTSKFIFRLIGLIQGIVPYLKGSITPPKNILCVLSLLRSLLIGYLAVETGHRCQSTHSIAFTVELSAFCCLIDDLYLWQRILRGKPVLETHTDRFLFCFGRQPRAQ